MAHNRLNRITYLAETNTVYFHRFRDRRKRVPTRSNYHLLSKAVDGLMGQGYFVPYVNGWEWIRAFPWEEVYARREGVQWSPRNR